MLEKYTSTQIDAALEKLNATLVTPWHIDKNNLCKKFKFKDFKCAFEFMKKSAVEIDRLDHHPDWSNVYNKVAIKLTTHEVDGISSRDFELAQIFEDIFKMS